jgi:hypothetical protein
MISKHGKIFNGLKFRHSRHIFNHQFLSPIDHTLIFEIKPLTHANLEENAEELTKTFKYEPVCERDEHDNLLKYFRKIAEKSLREELGITCYEKSSGKWAGGILIEDFSTSSTDPMIEKDGENDYIIDFLDFIRNEGFKKLWVSQSKKKYEQIHLGPGGVSKEFWGNMILANMLEYLINEHPIIKNSRMIFAECSNSNSRNACQKCGIDTAYSIKYSEMAKLDQFKEYLKDYKQILRNTNYNEDESASFNCLIKYWI